MFKKHKIEVILLSMSLLLVFSTGAVGANRDVCPSGWAYSHISEAFSDASTGDVIRVATGIYYEIRAIDLEDPMTITIQGGWNASFTSRSSDPSLTVVDMSDRDRFLYIYASDGETIDVTIENITLTGGLTTGYGGAVYAGASSGTAAAADTTVRLTLRGNLVSGNWAAESGGGISAHVFCESETVKSILDLTVVDNGFIRNASSEWGGALYLYGYSSSTPGQAVLRYTVERNAIQGNTAKFTGGLYMYHNRAAFDHNGSASRIHANDISGNSALETYALYVRMDAAVSSLPLDIKNNRICNTSKWSSGDGGGVYLYSQETSPVVNFVNNTISRNAGYGLKARSRGDSGVPDNFVLNLYNNIFHLNQPKANVEEVYLYNSTDGNMVANAGSNLFTGDLSGAVDVSTITFNDLGGNVIGDALLGDDFYPTGSSPAINNANAAQAPATDMNGTARVGAPDIGALEYSGSEHHAVSSVPTGPVEVHHVKAAVPTVSGDPLVARPFACGSVDLGTVSLRIALPAFSAPVDVYAGISVPWGPDVYLITPAGGLELLSLSLIKWKSGQTAGVDQPFFGSLDASILPQGRYGLHLLVFPAGTLSMAFHKYESEMIIH